MMVKNKPRRSFIGFQDFTASTHSVMESGKVKDSEDKDMCDITGHLGPWQMRSFTIFLFIAFSCSWHNLILTFQSPNVSYWCKSTYNASTVWKHDKHSECYDGENKCESWVYDESIYKSTIVSEWDLVCDRKWLTSVAKSIYMFGHLVACVAFGQLSDRIGRRPVILLCYFLFFWCSVATIFVNSIGIFIFLRFFLALGVTAAYTTAFVIVMEVMGSEVRPLYGVVAKFGWTLAYVSLPIVAWFIRDWRQLQIAITLPWVAMIPMWWYLEESPRWLLTTGQVERAEVLLLEACEKNGKRREEVQVPILKLCSRTLKAGRRRPRP
ncbi:solute carrier family 22 member 5-like [Stegodyphus dumicola]|uniref:solute carrier family 22 member 5-like n=1 Tax=Stegodyphus dumicola TaxID=202533 RepID=UPI0015AA8658|nr:solute carrier family 22 member 5-like [Stegodyphus dumicola]